MRWTVIGLGLTVFAGVAIGQVGEEKLTFEVASVKPSGPTSVRNFEGGPGSKDPGRYTATKAAFMELVFTAYRGDGDARPLPVTEYDQITGPGWIEKEEYDVVVKIPEGTTKEQFRRMFQNLLAERFNLAVHHETKVLPVYELVVTKSGPKLKESLETAEPTEFAQGPFPLDKDGFPTIPAGQPGFVSNYQASGFSRWMVRRQGMAALCRSLSSPNAAARWVIDKTGLTGKYDFTLYYDWKATRGLSGASDADPAPTLEQALQQQLGLKLVDAKAPFDIVVVDHAEKVPAEN